MNGLSMKCMSVTWPIQIQLKKIGANFSQDMCLELHFLQTVHLNLHLALLQFQSDNKALRLHPRQYRRQYRHHT